MVLHARTTLKLHNVNDKRLLTTSVHHSNVETGEALVDSQPVSVPYYASLSLVATNATDSITLID